MRARRILTASFVILAGIAVPALPAAAGGGCHRPNTEGAGTTVHLTGACMSPTILRTDVGATVTFINDDDLAHNVTGNPVYADLPVKGDSTTLRYPGAGTYPYTCTLHPGMNGVVVVGGGMGMAKPELIAATSAAPAPSTDSDDGSRGIPLPVAVVAAVVVAAGAAFAGRRSAKAVVAS